MNDPALIEDLIRAGVEPSLIARVVAEIVSAASTGHPVDASTRQVDTSTRLMGGSPVESPGDNGLDKSSNMLERRRKWDREYRKKRRKASTGCPPDCPPDKVDASTRHPPDAGCNFLNSSSLFPSLREGNKEESETEVSKEVSPRVRARGQRPPDIHPTKVDAKTAKLDTRGTRMSGGQPIPESCRKFARDGGMDDKSIDRLWLEFVDYWIGVPGQRGIKLNWDATWRNRVRYIIGSNGNGTANGHRINSSAGRSQANGDPVLAAVARYASKRGLIKPTDGPSNGEVPGYLDLAAEPDAD